MNESLDRFTEWDAAYVLGSLSVAERREFEDHLAGCTTCQAAVSELAGLPGLLAQVPNGDAMALSESGTDDLPPSLVGKIVKRRTADRRRAWLTAAALVLALLIGAGIGYIAHGPRPEQPAPTPTTSVSTPARLAFLPVRSSSMTAVVDVMRQGSGTEFRVECQYGSGGAHNPTAYAKYAIYVIDRSGAAIRAKTWKAKPGKVMTPVATSPLPPEKIDRVEIRLAGSQQVLMKASLH